MDPLNPGAIALLIVYSAFALPIVVHDLRSFRVPDAYSLGGLLAATAFVLASDAAALPGRAAAALVAFVLFAAIARLTGSMGEGDVKLSALVSFFSGPRGFAPFLLATAAGALLFAAWRLASGRGGAKDRVPFAPFLVAGGYAAWAALSGGLV